MDNTNTSRICSPATHAARHARAARALVPQKCSSCGARRREVAAQEGHRHLGCPGEVRTFKSGLKVRTPPGKWVKA